MSGNPKSSPWWSTGATARHRQAIKLTLSPAAAARLAEIAALLGESRSRVVERAIEALDASRPTRRV